jgi:single-stranded DNA-binding protein
MFSVAITGYITGDVKVEDTEYGKRGIVSLRVKSGKQAHYFNCTFFGKKIDLAEKYMHDGRQVSFVGTVRNATGKKKKDGTEYCAFYMDVSDFSFPEKLDGEESYSRQKPATAPAYDPSDEEIPF